LSFEKYLEIAGIFAAGLLAAFGIVFANRKSDLKHNNAKAGRWVRIKAAFADLTFFGWLAFAGGLVGSSYAVISTWQSATELRESKRRELILQLKGIELKPRVTILFHLRHALTDTADAQAAEKQAILRAYSPAKYPMFSIWPMASRELRERFFPGVVWQKPNPAYADSQGPPVAGLDLSWGDEIRPALYFNPDAAAYVLPSRAEGADHFGAWVRGSPGTIAKVTFHDNPLASATGIATSVRKGGVVATLWRVASDPTPAQLVEIAKAWKAQIKDATLCIEMDANAGMWLFLPVYLGKARLTHKIVDYFEQPLVASTDIQLLFAETAGGEPQVCQE
jgi:hypothetical protein